MQCVLYCRCGLSGGQSRVNGGKGGYTDKWEDRDDKQQKINRQSEFWVEGVSAPYFLFNRT